MVRSDGTVHLSTGTGFGAPVPWGVGMPPYALFPSAGDINGDGLADILWSDGNSTMFVQFSTGSGFVGVIHVASAPQYDCDGFGGREVGRVRRDRRSRCPSNNEKNNGRVQLSRV